MYINAIAIDPNNEPMAKLMKEYFEIGLGDLMNDLINHKNKPFYKRIGNYHKELERIYVKMINVIITLNNTKI